MCLHTDGWSLYFVLFALEKEKDRSRIRPIPRPRKKLFVQNADKDVRHSFSYEKQQRTKIARRPFFVSPCVSISGLAVCSSDDTMKFRLCSSWVETLIVDVWIENDKAIRSFVRSFLLLQEQSQSIGWCRGTTQKERKNDGTRPRERERKTDDITTAFCTKWHTSNPTAPIGGRVQSINAV